MYVRHTIAETQGSILKDLTDSSLAPPAFPLTILVGGTQVAMTPDCFVCPLTSLRGAVVNQALHVRGKQKGGEAGDGGVGGAVRGLHFLCKK